MDFDQAEARVLYHADISTNGFLGMLRPYTGLIEDNFHDFLQAIFVIGEQWHVAEQVDRKLVFWVWDTCWRARHWGIEPPGMLQRNNLITPEDTDLLNTWIDALRTSALRFLAGAPPRHSLNEYAHYIINHGPGNNVDYFIPLLNDGVSDPESVEIITVLAKALGRLGDRAERALPNLEEAAQRNFTHYEPHERCNTTTREAIREAIQQIRGSLEKSE